ncbi:MAG: SMP-30/gluconolactonase/LRE family protein [Limnohabitans sp.]
MMSSTAADWQPITTVPDGLSESPFWHPQEKRLYWVDIPGRRLARLAIAGQMQPQGEVDHWPMAQEPGCIAPVQGGGLIIALRDGIYLGKTWGGPLQRLAAAPYDTTKLRFNDGKCDAQGRFWVGSMYEPRDKADGVLYCLSGNTLLPMAHQATVANGLAWSPDGKTLYWSCTGSHQVRAWDWDAQTQTMTHERLFHQVSPKPAGWGWDQSSGPIYGGRPDGATADAQGNYYSAMYEGKRIVKLSPQGRVSAVFETPVQCPTMPCFGGDDLKTLFITSSRHGRSEAELAAMPGSGCVWAMRVDVPGLPVNFYKP